MRNWTNDERVMIACCNDGTRPVIFKIERMDYKVIKIDGMDCGQCAEKLQKALESVSGVDRVEVKPEKKWAEVFVIKETPASDEDLKNAVEQFEGYRVEGIE